MTSQLGWQTITIHILSNIWRSKDNQAMKFGQLIKYKMIYIFLQTLYRKWIRKTSSRPLFIFKKSFIKGKSKWTTVYFQYLSIARNLAYNKSKLYKTLKYWSRDMHNVDFLEKGLWIVSLAHFVYEFSRKMLLLLYSTKWPISFFVRLYFLIYWAICVLQLFVPQVCSL